MSQDEWALSNKIFSCPRHPRIASCSAPCCYRASLCLSTNHRSGDASEGRPRQAHRIAARNVRRENRPERHPLLHARPDALCFLPGVLSGKIRQGRQVRSRHTSRRSDFLQEWNSGERNAAAHARAGRSEIAHRIIPDQPAAREASSRTLHGTSARNRGGHATLRVRSRLPRDRTPTSSSVRRTGTFHAGFNGATQAALAVAMDDPEPPRNTLKNAPAASSEGNF